ncbi:MAG: glycerophosphodiester phosphodiesterase [Betaproteobacteria bacterium]|nr:MAG: glycerophosphodiester phosphodiesterase [Betaproteobacteria bacterium]
MTERPYWPYPRILAHRGGGLLAPENTLAALRYARNLGFEGVEFDVKLTADDVPVLFHDDTLDRTTDGNGPIADVLFDVVTQLDAGSWFANEFAGDPVPAFAAASALCKETGLWANVEIKPCPGRERETGRIVARMAKLLWSGATPLPLLSSFSTEALLAAQTEASDLPRALVCDEIPDDWEQALDQLDCVSLHVRFDRLNTNSVAAIQATRRGVLAYTVNDPLDAVDLIEMGVDALVTDQIDVIGPHFA